MEKMKEIGMRNLILLLFTTAGLAAAQGANTDPSLIWTIYAGYQPVSATYNGTALTMVQPCSPGAAGCVAAAINGDEQPYVNGQSGVSNCQIHISGTNSTYDATCSVSKPRTPFTFNFGTLLAKSASSPSPAWGFSGTTTGTLLNVSHLLDLSCGVGCTQELEYTARFTSQLGGGTYHLRMNSAIPQPDMPPPSYWSSYSYNDPYQTALVRVHHCPGTLAWSRAQIAALSPWCSAGPQKETWYIYPDAGPQGAGSTQTLTPIRDAGGNPLTPTQVGTLVSAVTKGTTTTITTIGQYAMPFFFKLQVK